MYMKLVAHLLRYPGCVSLFKNCASIKLIYQMGISLISIPKTERAVLKEERLSWL